MPADDYPEVGEIERDVIANDQGEIEADVVDDSEAEEEEEYEVQDIVGARMEKGGRYKCTYLVAWKGYGAEHNTWEPEANVEHAKELINAYWDRQPKGKRPAAHGGTPAKPPAQRGRASRASQAASATSIDDSNVNFEDTHKDSSDKFKDVADWEPLVKSVDTVERGSDDELLIYITMKSGERLAQTKEVVYQRCPQAMLRFYEGHLKWRNGGV